MQRHVLLIEIVSFLKSRGSQLVQLFLFETQVLHLLLQISQATSPLS